MKDVLFISPETVREITVISDNLSDKYLLSSIREQQDIDFQEVIGTNLYKKLKQLLIDGQMDGDYKELLNEARYFLAYGTIANLILNTTYKVSNIGLNTTTDENVQIPQMRDILTMKEYYIDKKDFYKLRLQKYLCEQYHNGKLKELTEAKYWDMHNNLYSASSSPVFLGGRRGKGRYTRHIGYDKP